MFLFCGVGADEDVLSEEHEDVLEDDDESDKEQREREVRP
jgi:hypothetical protein